VPSARTELSAEVVAALLELGDDGFLLLGLAEHQRAVLRVCRSCVAEAGTEVTDRLLKVLDLSLDAGELGAGVVVRDVVCHLSTLRADSTGAHHRTTNTDRRASHTEDAAKEKYDEGAAAIQA
jgi:hypothetical protein